MELRPEKRWRPRGAVEAGGTLPDDLPPLLARLLLNRGISDSAAAALFLSGGLGDIRSPLLIKGMAEGAARLAEARSRCEHVMVSGDYDVDGITSLALLVSFFRAVGISCSWFIPDRAADGYGFGAAAVRAAVAAGASVVVTVDCGISAHDGADACARAGIDLIITDHHLPGELLPRARTVIDPHQPGCGSPFKGLSGVGIAFSLAMALRERLRCEGGFPSGREPNLREYLDLVALGTIADIVPLVEENRIFVRYGLKELTAGRRPGIAALKEVAGIAGEVNCGVVGFRLAPRLNACGRLEHAGRGVELLLTDDPVRAGEIARELDADNSARQALEQEILSDALAKVSANPEIRGKKAIVLASEEWHPGVIGIVASRIVDLFHRPTILVALNDGSGKGSGRSIPSFHLYEALSGCADHLTAFGGHRHAAGLSVDEGTLAAFVANFEAVADGLLDRDDLIPELCYDADLTGQAITLETALLCGRLAPFGAGNPEPAFLCRGAAVLQRRVLSGRHLKLTLGIEGSRVDAIGFNMADRQPADRVDIIFSPQANDWRGRRSVQLRLRDMKPALESG